MRVNIEESVWTDQRFINLCIEMNMHDYEAVGVMAKVWYHCQKNGTDTLSHKILFHLIKKNKLILGLEQVGLLEKISDNFRVVGMKTRLEEIAVFKNKRSEAGRLGGIHSGEKRKQTASKGEALASICSEANGKQNEASMSMSMSEEDLKNKEDLDPFCRSEPSAYEWPNNVGIFGREGEDVGAVMVGSGNGPELADLRPVRTPNPSASIAKPKTERKTASKKQPEALATVEVLPKTPSWSSKAYDHWRMLYKKTYNAEPGRWSKAEWGALNQIHDKAEKDVDKVCQLLQHYFRRRDYDFTKSGHSVMKILPSFHRLWAEVQNGKKITDSDMRQASKDEGNNNAGNMAIERINAGLPSEMDAINELADQLIAEEKRIHQGNARTALEANEQKPPAELV